MRKTILFAFAMFLATTMMAQNRATLLEESFNGSSIPSGWSVAGVGSSNWVVSGTNNAGGQANELHLNWSPQFNGVSRFVSPVVDLTGLNSVVVSFKHFLDYYNNGALLGIATTSNGGTTWNQAWSQNYTSDALVTVTQEITTSDVGSANFQFCIFYSGNSYNFDNWYFDDIQLFTLENLDLAVTGTTMPDITQVGNLSVNMNVMNYGATAVSSIEASYAIDGMAPVTQTFNVNLASFSSTSLNFSVPAVLETPGSYTVMLSINHVNGGNDDIAENNTFVKTISVPVGYVQRVPMIEHFSSSTCGPCVSVNNSMNAFCNNNAGRFTYTKYQMNWPGNGDPYYTAEGGVRRSYYGVTGVPNVFLDGVDLGNNAVGQSSFNQHANQVGFFDIRGSFSVEGNTIHVIADVMPYFDVEARVFVSVNEKVTTGNVGSNGETSFHHVFMKMLPDGQGSTIAFTADEIQRLEFTQDLSSTNVEEMNDLEVSIWVQNYGSKYVYNSRFAYEYTNIHPYPVENLILAQGTNAGESTMVATWNSPSSGNPTGYNVYVNNELVAENINSLSYSFPGESNQYYVVGVTALYSGNKTSVEKIVGLMNNTVVYTISTSASPSDGGTVTGGGTFQQGQSCSVSATANSDYSFTNWTENGNEVSNNASYTFTVSSNRNLVANFALLSPVVGNDGPYCEGETIQLTATGALGASYSWSGPNGFSSSQQNPVISNCTMAMAGTYTCTITKGGQTISASTDVVIYNSEAEDFNVIECDSYTWHGTEYTSGGTYQYETTTAQGCPRIETLHLTINYSEIEDFTATACDSYTWHGTPYIVSGTYTFETTTAEGCPKTETLHLTINDFVYNDWYAESCTSYAWNGETYFETGDYVQTLTTAQGCDSIVTLHLIISDAISVDIYKQACNSYTWNGVTYSTDGDYTQMFTSSQGCDSIVTLHLTLGETVYSDMTVEACDAYEWFDGIHLESGVYEYIFHSLQSCDSVVTLNLTIYFSEVEEYTVTANDSYTWHGITYTESGMYTYETTTAQGCMRIETLYLTITHEQQYYIISASAGMGGSISPEGDIQVEAGGTVAFSIVPNEGYSISVLMIDGVENPATDTYTFSNVDGNHAIKALFTVIEGVDEHASPDMKLYPNPAKDKINVESPSMKRIAVFNLLGVLVGSMNVNGDYAVVGTDELSQGTYIMKVEYNDGRVGYSQFVVVR